jgi:hypothetical protein
MKIRETKSNSQWLLDSKKQKKTKDLFYDA